MLRKNVASTHAIIFPFTGIIECDVIIILAAHQVHFINAIEILGKNKLQQKRAVFFFFS